MSIKKIKIFRKSLSLIYITSFIFLGNFFLFSNIKSSSKSIIKENHFNSIYNHSKAITVKILSAGGSGSGVLISKKGKTFKVITAWHVIKDNLPSEELFIITPDGKKHLWNPLSLEKINNFDLATFEFFSENNYELADLKNKTEFRDFESIFIAGFPVKNSSKLLFSSGSLVINADINLGQGYQMLYTNKTREGMSGGPILSKNGTLIGIHGRAELSDDMSLLKNNISKHWFNQGIPIKHYKNFLFGRTSNEKDNKLGSEYYLAKAYYLWNKDIRSKQVINYVKNSLDLKPSFLGYYIYIFSKFNDLDPLERDLLVKKALDLPFNNESDYMIYKRALLQSLINKEKATILLDERIEKNPDFAMSLFLRGIWKSSSGDKKGALDDYSKAIIAKPEFSDPYINKARIYSEKGPLQDYDAAIENYSHYLKIHQGDIRILFERGKIESIKRKYLNAKNDFIKAINIFETNYLPNISFIKDNQHPYLQAFLPLIVDIYIAKAESEIKIGDNNSAHNTYTKLISILPKIFPNKSEAERNEISSMIFSKIADIN